MGRTILRALSVMSVLALGACNGGSYYGSTSSGGGGTTGAPSSTPANVNLVPSSQTLSDNADGTPSGGTPITVSAIVTDAKGSVVQNATVNFVACLPGTPTTVVPSGTCPGTTPATPRTGTPAAAFLGNPAVTDANGLATVTMTTGGNPSHGQVNVIAFVGTANNLASPLVINVTAPAAGPSAAAPASVTLVASSPQLSSNATQPANGITLTAFVKDASQNVIPGAIVGFSTTDPGVNLIVTNNTTDANGAATAVLTVGNNPQNRTVVVTATAGGAPPGTVSIAITGTTLSLSGPSNLQFGAPSTFVATLKDSGGTGIFNKAIALSSTMAGTFNPASPVNTDANGQVTFTFTPTGSGSTATMQVSAFTGTLTQTLPVNVSQDSFTFTAPTPTGTQTQPEIPLCSSPCGSPTNVTVHWTSSGVAQSGKQVSFATTRGTLSSTTATTDASGNATVTIFATQAGPATITATGANGPSATLNIAFIATNPATISVQPNPATIGTNQSSTITAVVRDAANNLVTGATVSFTLQDTTGGRLSAGSAVTDTQGRAVVVYTASSTTSSANGVSITASVTGATPATATLTVGGAALRIVMGTGNVISALNTTQYQMPWAIQVSDAAGNPAVNANVNLSIQDLQFRKGTSAWDPVARVWYHTNGAGGSPISCTNEDMLTGNPNFDLNGVLDPGEDLAGTGQLVPGSIGSVPAQVTLDSNGSAVFNITYPKSEANWVTVRLRADVTVAGTEGISEQIFDLPVLAADISSQSTAPPGFNSPYGVLQDCAHEPVANFVQTEQGVFNGKTAKAYVTLSSPAGNNSITIPFTISSAATQGTDYNITMPSGCTTSSCSITIPAGGTQGEIDVQAISTATGPVTLTLGTPSSQAVIGTDGISKAYLNEVVLNFLGSSDILGENVTTAKTITVQADQAVPSDVTFTFALGASSTAIQNTDFSFANPPESTPSFTLTIPMGASSTSMDVASGGATSNTSTKIAQFILSSPSSPAVLGSNTTFTLFLPPTQ